MRIGELAARGGTTAKTIRYYESIGLLPRPARTDGGYRDYTSGDAQRLRFIQQAKALGFSLDEVRDIREASNPASINCEHVLALLERKRDEIAARIREAMALRDALDHTLAASRARLGTEPSSAHHCPVIARGLHERALHAAGLPHDAEAPARQPVEARR